ncbi:MAG: hypothetical protein H6R11_957, partial [Proteobacteria bacterium]|nr:hypothetical protein [Pseudomonadota bacterium]
QAIALVDDHREHAVAVTVNAK